MTELEQQQAEEIAELRAKLAAAENGRDRNLQLYHQSEREKDNLENVFVKLLSRICQRD